MTRSFFGWLLCVWPLAASAAESAPISDREGVPVIDWRDAGGHLDQRVLVQGRIVSTRNIGSICFLNFDDSSARAFTAVIRKANFDRFPERPETAYRGKNVRILGTITEYQGKPQIVVSSPQQIEVLDELRAPTRPATRPAVGEATALTIATFNTLNLFDDHDDPYRDDEGTPAKPRAELERLAAAIRTVDADVIALQEVENRDYLERFVRALLPDMGYEHVVQFEGNDRRGIDCAVLSRVPVGPVTSYRHLRFRDAAGRERRFERDLLRVRLEPAGSPPFDLFVVHLKSKSSGADSDVLRQAEAYAVRAAIDEALARDAGARFLVCGDFNDTWDSPALRIIRGSGTGELKTFFEEIPAEGRITYNKEPHREMIDFLLCSPAMAAAYVPGSFRILPGSPETTGSDHNAVAARFRLK